MYTKQNEFDPMGSYTLPQCFTNGHIFKPLTLNSYMKDNQIPKPQQNRNGASLGFLASVALRGNIAGFFHL